MSVVDHGEQTGLIRSSDSSKGRLMPVDHVSAADQRRCSRRQLCVTVLVAACLGVTVCLVIALPLSYRGGGSSGVSTTAGDDETVQVHGLPLPVLMQSENNDVIPRAERTAVARPVSLSSETQYHCPPTSTPAAMKNAKPTSGRRQTPLLDSCPRVSDTVRGSPVKMEHVNGSLWYELRRVQTHNSPVYVSEVACSTMHVTMSSPLDAEMQLSWDEEFLYRRRHRTVKLQLHRNTEDSDDWIEQIKNETDLAQINFLVHVDEYLLVYECFPNVRWNPKPGYVLRVYARSPHGNAAALDGPLMVVAQIWGLNPAQLPSRRIRQRFCDVDGHDAETSTHARRWPS